MAKGNYSVVVKNKPIASQLKAYEARERGYSLIEKELKRRFAGLDWRYQKRIIVDFIQGNRSNREWVMPKLLDIWDKSFEPLVKEAWEKYHEERCSWVVIRQMPEEYVLSQIDELVAIEGNYRFVCRRLAGNSRFEVDMNRLEPLDFMGLMKNGGYFVKMDSDELVDVFLKALYNWTKHITRNIYYRHSESYDFDEQFLEITMGIVLSRMKGEKSRFMYLLQEIDVSDSRNAEFRKKVNDWHDKVCRATMSDIDNAIIERYGDEFRENVQQAELTKHIREDLQKRYGWERDANDKLLGRYLHDVYTNGDVIRVGWYERMPFTTWARSNGDDVIYNAGDGKASLEEFAKINPYIKDMLGMFEVDDKVCDLEVPF